MWIGCGIYWVGIVLVVMLKRRWSINYTLINLGKVVWNVQANGRIRIDCICVTFCICGFVCKWLYIPALYSRLGFSVSVSTSLLVDCYSVYATTSIFHFPEQCGDPSVYLFYHDRTLMAWPLIWYYLITLYVHLSSNGTESTSGSLSVVLSMSESYVYYEYTC